ncbi:hypothetical protein DFJ73DRAFT_251690, partial [Zopfochytrium polystomum]
VSEVGRADDNHHGNQRDQPSPAKVLEEIADRWAQPLGLTRDDLVAGAFPLTPLQFGTVSATIQNPSAYILQEVFRLDPSHQRGASAPISKAVDADRLEHCFNTLIAAHPVLRTTFLTTAVGGVWQMQLPHGHHVGNGGAGRLLNVTTTTDVKEFVRSDLRRGFQIDTDRLWVRMTLLSVVDNVDSSLQTMTTAVEGSQTIVFTIHHALYDGWTVERLFDDLLSLYYGRVDSDAVIAAGLQQPSFRHVVRGFEAAASNLEHASFWKAYLADLAPAEPLTLGRATTSFVDSISEDAPVCLLSRQSLDKAKEGSRAANVPLSILLKAAWALTLRKYERSSDVVFGHVMYSRHEAGSEGIVGPLINTVPFRIHLDDSISVQKLLTDVLNQHNVVQEYAGVSLADAHRWANLSGQAKLFNTLFVLEDVPLTSIAPGPFIRESPGLGVFNHFWGFSFEIVVCVLQDSLQLHALFSHSDMSKEMAATVLLEYDYTLSLMLEVLLKPEAPTSRANLSSFWTLSPPQTASNAAAYFGRDLALPHYGLVLPAFEERVLRNPRWTAVEHGTDTLTYDELDAVSSHLASQLSSVGSGRRVVGVGCRVAIVMRRSIPFIVSVIAILKTGATIVPIDADFPPERISFMVLDAEVQVVLYDAGSSTGQIGQLSRERVLINLKYNVSTSPLAMAVNVEDILDHVTHKDGLRRFRAPSEDLATGDDSLVILYTSGSTGKPKGVSLSHICVGNTVFSQLDVVGCREQSRMLQFMAVGFDVFQQEVWSALVSGATLVLREDNVFETLKRVDSIYMTPTGLGHLGDPLDYPNIKTVCVAGEACPQELKDLWSPHVQFSNLYGPSEAYVTHSATMRPEDGVTIGKPIPNAACYILDENMRPVPVGVLGEIYLGGVGISKGYVNLPDLTANRFVDDPFLDDHLLNATQPHLPRLSGRPKMFKSGDLGRLLPDGNFDIQGRRDDMVKLKGYRVELGEVAATMMRHPLVTNAAAVVIDGRLVGFASPKDVSTESLRSLVSQHLPVYMVPTVFVTLERMPTNPNGKTDRKILQAMTISVASELTTDSERKLASIWANFLGVPLRTIGSNTSFFSLGGDSLNVIRVAAASSEAGLPITVAEMFKTHSLSHAAAVAEANRAKNMTFEWPVASLSRRTMHEIQNVWSPLLRINRSNIEAFPTTPLQSAMILGSLKNPAAYMYQAVYTSKGHTVDLGRLQRAVRSASQTYEILRTVFVSTASEGLIQVVRPRGDHIPVSCVTNLTLANFLASDTDRGFPVSGVDAHWLRVTLILGDAETINVTAQLDQAQRNDHVVVTIHHALYDGWSVTTLTRAIIEAYEAESSSSASPISRQVGAGGGSASNTLRPFINYLSAQPLEPARRFWVDYMRGVVPAPSLSFGAQGQDGVAVCGPEIVQNCSVRADHLAEAAKSVGVTTATLMRAAWALTLRKFYRADEVTFGQVLARRDAPVKGVESIAGPLLNTVPCRVKFSNNQLLRDLLVTLQEDHNAMLPYSHSDLVVVQKWSDLPGNEPLFNTLFLYENLPDGPTESLFSTFVTTSEGKRPTAQSYSYHFELVVQPEKDEFLVNATYDPAHLNHAHAILILDEYQYTVSRIIKGLQDRELVGEQLELSPGQQYFIQRHSSGPTVEWPDRFVHHAFEKASSQYMEFTAVEHRGEKISYAELNNLSKKLATQLSQLGISTNDRVAIVAQRSFMLIVSLLAVLKAGATAVPIDSTFPDSRIRYMVEDSSSKVILATSDEISGLSRFHFQAVKFHPVDLSALKSTDLSVDGLAGNGQNPSDALVILYTSGSTGKPKGVHVSHVSVANVIFSQRERVGCFEGSRMLQFMAIGFDMCQQEIWSALTSGSTLVLRDDEDVGRSLRTVDSAIITPTGLAQIGKPTDFPNLRTVSVIGEPCPSELKNLWSPHVVFNNTYGPTEATIVTHGTRLFPDSRVTIGRPIANTSCFVVDQNMQQVPIGVVGEICVGGLGLSPGYINLPELTAAAFVPNPFSSGGDRLYRTGDLGRVLPSGDFEVLGRRDEQVKLKGYRVELGEVEAALTSHPRVSTAAVIVKDKTHLVAFVTPADVVVDELRDVAAAKLPPYMVPAAYVRLSQMPVNANGKTDKKALASMAISLDEGEEALTE